MTGSAPSPLGQFIREQRQLAQLSLREMARVTRVSNAYLSQIERGLHEPSVRILQAVAQALAVPVEDLVNRSVHLSGLESSPAAADHGVEHAVRRDPHLSAAQKDALLSVYRSFVSDPEEPS
jgi:transcriptional regulator with XRE-family HTH domain